MLRESANTATAGPAQASAVAPTAMPGAVPVPVPAPVPGPLSPGILAPGPLALPLHGPLACAWPYPMTQWQPLPGAPTLSQARVPLLREVSILDEYGQRRPISIPAERPLTLFVDKHELVTLMTLGALPELLALGYLLNQRLIEDPRQMQSVSVDWDVNAAAMATWRGMPQLEQATAHRVVTTGCGQGVVFGQAAATGEALASQVKLPSADEARISQRALKHMLDVVRAQPSVHSRAGSVHGCGLFEARDDGPLLFFVEDVGRHNALDTVTGWMAMQGLAGGDKVLYTTGRLTTEMVTKAALMGVPIVASRNGATASGQALAERLGMALFGRAANRHFLCYSGQARFDAQPLPPSAHAVRVIAG